jgi:hypothetical protein
MNLTETIFFISELINFIKTATRPLFVVRKSAAHSVCCPKTIAQRKSSCSGRLTHRCWRRRWFTTTSKLLFLFLKYYFGIKNLSGKIRLFSRRALRKKIFEYLSKKLFFFSECPKSFFHGLYRIERSVCLYEFRKCELMLAFK